MAESVMQKVQCSRCLNIQQADISETLAIVCEWCGEVDAAHVGEDIID